VFSKQIAIEGFRPSSAPRRGFDREVGRGRIVLLHGRVSLQNAKLSELVHRLEQATGKKAIIQHEAPQQGDVPLTWAGTSKAGRLPGYRPLTTLEEGLKKFVAWYRAADPSLHA
jgi:nucleoside-diphosphate-sugar epimerase